MSARKRGWLADYESWTFGDRAFLRATSISIVWHLFWFFAITIVVSPPKVKPKPHPRVISLGPVLDDSIMRTLVETRPEISQAFYRPFTELPAPPPPPAPSMERLAPGSVVSVPFGRRFLESVKMLVGGQKASPAEELAAHLNLGFGEEVPEIEGGLKGRGVVSRPEEPQILTKVPAGAEIEIQFAVDADGGVTSAEVTVSSGNAGVDEQWLKYLRRWQFAPLGLDKPPVEERGRVRFRLDGKE